MPPRRASAQMPGESAPAASKSAARRSAATSVAICPAVRCRISRGRPSSKKRHAAMSIDDPHVRCLPDNPPRPVDAAASDQSDSLAETAGAALRSQRDVPADLHRRPAVAGGPDPDVERLLRRPLGRRHARRETRGFRDDLWIDTWGSPMSDAAKMTEKFRRPNFGTLEIELTIDDPKVYTKPFTVKLTRASRPTPSWSTSSASRAKDYDRLQRSRGK